MYDYESTEKTHIHLYETKKKAKNKMKKKTIATEGAFCPCRVLVACKHFSDTVFQLMIFSDIWPRPGLVWQ